MKCVFIYYTLQGALHVRKHKFGACMCVMCDDFNCTWLCINTIACVGVWE